MLSLLTVGFERYMNPEGFRRLGGALLDELVILEMLHHPCKPLHACGGIGDADVGSLACHVLRVWGATHNFIQSCRAITRTDCDGLTKVLAQGFEHVLTEVTQVGHYLLCGGVVNASGLGGCATGEFRQAEMWGQIRIFHMVYSFHALMMLMIISLFRLQVILRRA